MSAGCNILENIINPLVTLVAAFAGAWLAFRFEKHRRIEEEKNKHIASANLALFTIYNMWNILFQYYNEVITPFKNKEDAWLNMDAISSSSNNPSEFSYETISFILQSSSPNTFSKLILEEQRFNSAINLIQSRSELMLSQVFPRLSRAGLKVGGSTYEDSMESIIGIDNTHKLKQYTKGIINNVTLNLESLVSTHDELHSLMKSIYPKEKFIKVKFSEAKKST